MFALLAQSPQVPQQVLDGGTKGMIYVMGVGIFFLVAALVYIYKASESRRAAQDAQIKAMYDQRIEEQKKLVEGTIALKGLSDTLKEAAKED